MYTTTNAYYNIIQSVHIGVEIDKYSKILHLVLFISN